MNALPTRLFRFVLSVCIASQVALDAQTRPAPEALARSLQQRYQGIKDFSADFVHSYRGGVLKTQTQERGKVTVKKPSRMHWTYTAPEKKEFVSDGVKIYSYIPQDRQVIVSSVPPDDEARTPRSVPCRAKATSSVISQQLTWIRRCPGRWR